MHIEHGMHSLLRLIMDEWKGCLLFMPAFLRFGSFAYIFDMRKDYGYILSYSGQGIIEYNEIEIEASQKIVIQPSALLSMLK